MTKIVSRSFGSHREIASAAPVLLVGPHRSGTSLLAEMLSASGLFLGARLDSHHESTYFQRIARRLLSELGAHWSQPSVASIALADESRRADTAEVLRNLLTSPASVEFWGRRRGHDQFRSAWGWKDPRTSVLLPLWLELFPQARIVSIERHPLDCALSLHRRSTEIAASLQSSPPRRLAYALYRGAPLSVDSWRCATLSSALDVALEYLEIQRANLRDFTGPIATTSYSELVQQPDVVLAKIGANLDLGNLTPCAAAVQPHPRSLMGFRRDSAALELARARSADLIDLGFSPE